MSNTRYRVPLQAISGNVPRSSDPDNPDAKGKVTRLSSLFGKSGSSAMLDAAKAAPSAGEQRDQSYIRQNASLARNIAYLSKQIQNIQQENGSLRHKVILYENASRIQQQKMKQSEEALAHLRAVREELTDVLLHLETAKQSLEKSDESDH